MRFGPSVARRPRRETFDRRFHLLLNVAVGGDWGGAQGVDPEIWPQRMVVDYVRVYQAEELQTPETMSPEETDERRTTS